MRRSVVGLVAASMLVVLAWAAGPVGAAVEDPCANPTIDARPNHVEGRVTRITGTDRADVIVGTPGRDIIRAGRGADIICGLDGRDVIFGEAGDDLIFGGPGNDRILGRQGDDTVHGGEGRDLIYGSFGDDVLHGEAGNDRIFGQDGRDQAFGGSGTDRIEGGSGIDELDSGRAGAFGDFLCGATRAQGCNAEDRDQLTVRADVPVFDGAGQVVRTDGRVVTTDVTETYTHSSFGSDAFGNEWQRYWTIARAELDENVLALLVVKRGTTGNPCIQIKHKWKGPAGTGGSDIFGHYDGRVVRNCQPGTVGVGFWSDAPTNFEEDPVERPKQTLPLRRTAEFVDRPQSGLPDADVGPDTYLNWFSYNADGLHTRNDGGNPFRFDS